MKMRNLSKLVLNCLFGCLLMASGLQAQEVELREGERIEIIPSTTPVAEEMRLADQYAQPEVPSEESCTDCACDKCKTKDDSESEVVANGMEMQFDFNHSINIYPYVYNHANTISGGLVEMTDGTTYTINPSQKWIVDSWIPHNDMLFVIQNNSFFSLFFSSPYKYKICNKMNGTYVEANLSLSPFANSAISISFINPNSRQIGLSDGSLWEISSYDDYIYYDRSSSDLSQRRWWETDTILVGANNDWFTRGRAFILINVNVNKFVRAKYLGRWSN